MAILPSVFGGSNNKVKTICVDYLRDVPALGDKYDKVHVNDPRDARFVENVGNRIHYNGLGNASEMELVGPNVGSNRKSLIIGQETGDNVSDRYRTFIDNTVSKYQRKIRRGNPDHNEKVLSDLQKEVWEYNVLDMLGYLNNEGAIERDLAAGKRKFEKDWGGSTELETLLYGNRIFLIANHLKDIQSINKSESFNVLVVTKTVNQEYVVFDGPSNSKLKCTDEQKLAEFLGMYEDSYLLFENFESEAKEVALLSTLRMQLKSNGKSIAIHRFPESNRRVLFSDNFKHKLLDQLSNDGIEQTVIEGESYWNTNFRIISLEPESSLSSETTEFVAAAKDENVLKSFISRTVSAFSHLSKKLSLMHFFNSFKKDMKKQLKINDEKDFIIYLKGQIENVRIVEQLGNGDIHFVVE